MFGMNSIVPSADKIKEAEDIVRVLELASEKGVKTGLAALREEREAIEKLGLEVDGQKKENTKTLALLVEKQEEISRKFNSAEAKETEAAKTLKSAQEKLAEALALKDSLTQQKTDFERESTQLIQDYTNKNTVLTAREEAVKLGEARISELTAELEAKLSAFQNIASTKKIERINEITG